MAYKSAVLGFSFLVYSFETYIQYRQHKKLSEKHVPTALSQIVTQETFDKSQSYGRDRSLFLFVSSAYSQLQTAVILGFDLLPALWSSSAHVVSRVFVYVSRIRFGDNTPALTTALTSSPFADPAAVPEIATSLAFTGAFIIANQILSAPLSYYSTFVVEKRHGFNKSTFGTWIGDQVKTLLLAAGLGGPVLAAALWIVQKSGRQFYFYLWGFLLLFQLSMMHIYPNFIQPLFNTLTPLSPTTSLHAKIRALAERASFPMDKVFVVDGSRRSAHSNAYMYGFGNNKRIVLFDTLVEKADEEEVIAVLAHEIGHWKRNHVPVLLTIQQINMFLVFYTFSHFAHHPPLFASFNFPAPTNSTSYPTLIAFLLFSFVLGPWDSVAGLLLNLLSRKNEFEADAYAKSLREGEQLRGALVKLHIENLGNLNPDKWYSTYHYSHPPLVERLEALDKTD
ncbi:hypothetical protein M427DRAFT_65593 [Gonapodya prolifera JEL478]|uniref:CAAX prenyl protease n=1 Tax=Gonapodya prolifera (strain JEL478) TaxID=1344416 RepID=A0A139AXZ9_GONPJ|nr:hypothetical protein M427DRAFT_65593 [Gonapodya prolifera JEL478]|eukprot:KXS21577.1 hypothetical protein M427DRAFT_65593 [Gonapodya prolifera JEL478]